MSIENSKKLNNLLTNWPDGLVKTSSALLSDDYSYQLIKKYVNSQWVRSIGSGAYTKLNDSPNVYGVLNAIQSQLSLKAHLGGISALEYHGYAQYSNLSEQDTYYLYASGDSIQKLPRWLSGIPIKLNYINKHLFHSSLGLEEKYHNGIKFSVSRAERAILELLALTPATFSLKFASDNIENLQLLNDDLTQKLLEECVSIKIKRLFLYLAEEKNLPCFKKLDISSIDLGKGKRVIGEGGYFISKYNISVPKDEFEDGIGYV